MARAVAWNSVAKWSTQILSWASTIVVARLLTPSDYGLVGMAGLYLALATLISQTGIGQAVITLRNLTRRKIAELNAVAVFIGLGLIALSCAVALPIARFFSAPGLRLVIIAASSTYLFNSFQVVPRALLQKELQFRLLAVLDGARVVCQLLCTIVLAWLGFGYWSLVGSHIFGTTLSAGLILIYRRHEFARPHLGQLGPELQLSWHVLTSGIAGYLYSNADFLVAGKILGQVPLGNYTVAWTVSSAPIDQLTDTLSVTPAYFSAVQTEVFELRRYLLRLTELLAYCTLPVSVGMALVADYFVPVVLGPKWVGVVGPLRLLLILFAFRSITLLLPRILTAIGDTRFVMWTTIVMTMVLPIAFVVGSRWGSSGIAAAWVVAYPPMMVPMYHRVFRKTDTRLKEYLSAVLPALSATAIMAVVVLIIRAMVPFGSHLIFHLCVLVIAGTLSYSGALLALFRERVLRVVRVLRNIRQQEQQNEEPSIPEVQVALVDR